MHSKLIIWRNYFISS